MNHVLLGSDFPLDLDRPFTYAMARAAGISRRSMAELVEHGLLRRLLRGVYAAAQAPDTQLLRAQAMQLVVPEGCIVTDESAGWLSGAAMILRPGAHLEPPPLTIFAQAGTDHDRLRNGLVASGTRHLLPRDITCVHGVLTTTPLRTAVDLGRLRHRDRAIAALDQLLRLGVFTLEELLAEIPRYRGMRGIRQFRFLAPLADGRSESPGESALRLRFKDAGLTTPEPQQNIYDARGRFIGRADLLIKELLFVAEYNGEEWHDEEQEPHDAARCKAMEDADHTVRVFTRHNVYGQHQDAIEILNAGVYEARRNLSRRRYA